MFSHGDYTAINNSHEKTTSFIWKQSLAEGRQCRQGSYRCQYFQRSFFCDEGCIYVLNNFRSLNNNYVLYRTWMLKMSYRDESAFLQFASCLFEELRRPAIDTEIVASLNVSLCLASLPSLINQPHGNCLRGEEKSEREIFLELWPFFWWTMFCYSLILRDVMAATYKTSLFRLQFSCIL